VVYETEIERIEYEPYIWRPVSTLKLVRSDTIDYASKYADRSELERLFAQRGTCDDILISKQGFVSDTFYANSAFWDGQNWYTPDTPLLAGTMRAFLLDQGQLREARIRQADLGKYMKVRLINAMNTLQEGAEIPMDRVII
jgi:4-amino-4-deoxychorismate lyase